jgi:hypothetical protein
MTVRGLTVRRRTMANYLCLGSLNPSIRLGPTENADEVLQRIDQARLDHGITHVQAVLQDGIEAQTVSVDPSHYGWWSVFHAPDPDETVA